MPGPLGPRGFWIYQSDDGSDYVVQLDNSKAGAGGFAPAPTDAAGGNYIRGWKMRHVYGEQGDGTRISLPIASASNSLFRDGGSFVVSGNSYEVRGRMGEKRPSA